MLAGNHSRLLVDGACRTLSNAAFAADGLLRQLGVTPDRKMAAAVSDTLQKVNRAKVAIRDPQFALFNRFQDLSQQLRTRHSPTGESAARPDS